MPSDPESKDHYSYEEMMARLRDNRPQSTKVKSEERQYDPETGITTVRKNKKRRAPATTKSLLKDPRWFRIIRKAVFISVPAASGLIVAAYFVLAGSVATDRFQEGLGKSVVRQFGLASKFEVVKTALDRLVLTVGKADFEGAPNQMVQSAKLKELDLHLAPQSFLGGAWTARYLIVRDAELVLRAPQNSETTGLNRMSDLLHAGFFLSDDPERIHFSEISVWNANVLFGDSDAIKAPGLRKVRIALSVRDNGSGKRHLDGQLSGSSRDGSLTLPGWVPFNVETIRLALHPDKLTIFRSVFHLGDDEMNKIKSGASSHIEVKGDVPLVPGKQAEIDLMLRGIILRDLLPKGISRFCAGVMRAESLKLTFDSHDPAATWKLTGAIALDMAQIRSLNLVTQLEDVTNGELTGIDLDEFTFDMELSPNGIKMQNITASTSGKIHLVGNIESDATGKMHGKIRVGLPREILLEKIPSAFTVAEDGIYWAEMNLGGTTTAPLEDLSPRLQAWAAGTGEAMRTPAMQPAGIDPELETNGPNAKDADQWEEIFDSLTNGTKPAAPKTPRPPVRPRVIEE